MSRLRLIAMKHAAEMREKEAMSNKKKLNRYSCETSNYGQDNFGEMVKSSVGSYIDIDELLAKLYEMKADACDPGENDALGSVIKLLEG